MIIHFYLAKDEKNSRVHNINSSIISFSFFLFFFETNAFVVYIQH